LVKIAESDKATDAARVSACIALLDRGWGKPDKTHHHDGDIRQHIISDRPLTDDEWRDKYCRAWRSMTVMTGLEPGFGVVNDLMVMQYDCLSTPEGQALGSRYGGRLLPRCDNFVEQREHRSMSPHVIDIDECGAPVQRAHGFDGKIVRLTAVIGYPVSRHNQRA
jgi:hypothetical protein